MNLCYKKWLEYYHNEKVVNLNDYLDKEDIELLEKLEIVIEKKIYTMNEYDMVIYQMLNYYTDEEEKKKFKIQDFTYLKSLEEKNIAREDFNKVLWKILKIKYPEKLN